MLKNLRRVKTCLSCKLMFRYEEYDAEDEFFCNQDGDRPLCGSVLLEEYGRDFDSKKWSDWEQIHRVYANTICDNFKDKEDK